MTNEIASGKETRMKAVRITEPKGFEGIDGLVYEEAPDPQPAIRDALVQVRAASFTPTELLWPLATDRNGHQRGARIPAHEGSGVVVALGYGSAGVSVGDEVYGLIDSYRDGWAAELVAIEVSSLAPKPKSVDFIEAAALPQACLTSWQALFDHGHLVSGQTVVIHGAAGGVGRVGVQLAKWAGAHVIGTGRAAARERVLAEGADDFVDVEEPGWETRIAPVDVVYDIIGGDVLVRSVGIVKPGGALVTIMGEAPTDRADIHAVGFVRDPNGSQLREISRLVDQGIIRPDVSAVYPLADAHAAFMDKSTKHIPGKVVLTP
jgi:NADPH:quinone reductase-like Zn-dependent oxidoreductase